MATRLTATRTARLVVWLAVALVAAWLLAPFLRQHATSGGPAVDTGIGVPVVMRTPGGVLEVATVRTLEKLKREDSKELWGIDLGTTVSMIQVPATYRFHIPLATEWTLTIRDTVATVRAPALQPSLPVAIDTTRLEKYTAAGWARFNKDENLEQLERSITPQLEQKARSAAYRDMATPAARQTVAEYVTAWLLREREWRRGGPYRVDVVFPHDPPAGGPPRDAASQP